MKQTKNLPMLVRAYDILSIPSRTMKLPVNSMKHGDWSLAKLKLSKGFSLLQKTRQKFQLRLLPKFSVLKHIVNWSSEVIFTTWWPSAYSPVVTSNLVWMESFGRLLIWNVFLCSTSLKLFVISTSGLTTIHRDLIWWNGVRAVAPSRNNSLYKHVAFALPNILTPETAFCQQVLSYLTAVAPISFLGLCILREHVTICRSFQNSMTVTNGEIMMVCLKTSVGFVAAGIEKFF